MSLIMPQNCIQPSFQIISFKANINTQAQSQFVRFGIVSVVSKQTFFGRATEAQTIPLELVIEPKVHSVSLALLMIEFHHRVHHFLHCFVEVFHLVGSQNTAYPIEALQGVNIDIRVKFITHFSPNYFKYGIEIVSNNVGVIFDESSQNEGGNEFGRNEGAHDREAMVIARSAIHHCLVGSSWGLVVEIFLHVPLFCFHGRYTVEETNREDPITLRLINDLFHSVLDFLVLKFPITTHHRVPPKQVMSRVLVEQSDSFFFQCA